MVVEEGRRGGEEGSAGVSRGVPSRISISRINLPAIIYALHGCSNMCPVTTDLRPTELLARLWWWRGVEAFFGVVRRLDHRHSTWNFEIIYLLANLSKQL
jgi:hypothetical protein